MQIFEVGGCVRDEILGVKSKDIDFTVVLNNEDMISSGSANPFNVMVQILVHMGFKIHVEHPEHLTVRAQFPKGHPSKVRDADFVLARKEGTYSDGRRPDSVQVGTLHDDLARRDFTMNAIAKTPDGIFVDPYNGMRDIADKVIRAVGDPYERITEDALRAVRAIRFRVTKGMVMDGDLSVAIQSPEVLDRIVNVIADERIKDEVDKMFAFSTLDSLEAFNTFPLLTEAIFAGSVSLTATMKQRR